MENIKVPLKLIIDLLLSITSDQSTDNTMSVGSTPESEQERKIEAIEKMGYKVVQSNKLSKDFQAKAKELLAKDLAKALKELNKQLNKSSDKYDEIILITARYNRVLKSSHKNLIDFAIVEISKLENAVLHIINNLEESDLSV